MAALRPHRLKLRRTNRHEIMATQGGETSPPARERETRAAAQVPSEKLMNDAKIKYPKWDLGAYKKLREGHPSMTKNAKEYACYLALKDLRPKPYKKGDCRSFQILYLYVALIVLPHCS